METFCEDDNCERAKEHDVELFAPTMGSVKEDKLSLADFQFSEKGEVVTCPQGHAPRKSQKEKKSQHWVCFTSLPELP